LSSSTTRAMFFAITSPLCFVPALFSFYTRASLLYLDFP